MTDDAICKALFACQKALRRLPLPHRRGVVNALHSGEVFKVGPITRGELAQGQRRPVYTGNVGLREGNTRARAAVKACRKACADLSEDCRARVMRGIMGWMLEEVSTPDEDEIEEMWN